MTRTRTRTTTRSSRPAPGPGGDAECLLAAVEFARGKATEVAEGLSVIGEAAMDGLPDVERIESMIRRGWERVVREYADEPEDLEVPAAMLERCALPYVRSAQGGGGRAFMPLTEPQPVARF